MNGVRLHVTLIEFPIVGAFLSTGLLLLSVARGASPFARRALQMVLMIAVLTIPAYLTGDPSRAALYALIAAEIMGAAALAALISGRHRGEIRRGILLPLLVFSIVNIVVVGWAARSSGHSAANASGQAQDEED